MTFDLSDYVCGGEIINTRRNSVHGYLALQGCDRPIVLQLTGNCSEDLAGLHIRFDTGAAEVEIDPAVEERMNELRLGWIQIGAPVEMTAFRPSSALYLEWHGQNGQTVVNLADVSIEVVADEDLTSDSEISLDDDPDLDDPDLDDEVSDDDFPDEDALHAEPGSQIASFERTDDAEPWNHEPIEDDGEADEDPFGLFPPDLGASLGAAAPNWGPEPDEATLAQWKEWDEVFEGTRDVPLSSLFDPPIQLPPVESLDDQQVARLFNTILGQLARHNVAFHMCEHYTPRTAYVLLVEQILREYGAHPELPRIGYTMNFDTAEFCPECQAEFEQRYEDRKESLLSESPEDEEDLPLDDDTFSDDDDDDVPF